MGLGFIWIAPLTLRRIPPQSSVKTCSLHKGATIGWKNRGKRQGAPVIGDCVWIGVNATVVGGITVGDDVLIAPGAYVNCDVPSHSIVLGNLCRVIAREGATEGYINRKVQI